MLDTVDHVVVAVRDLAAATRIYTDLLGRAVSWRGTNPGLGTANSLFRLENTYLELLAPVGEGPVGRALLAHLEQHGEGPFALAFGTADAEACVRILHERGIEVGEPIAGEGREETTGAVRSWRNVILPLAATRGVNLFAIEHGSDPEALPLAKPHEAPEAAITGLDHAVVQTHDPDAAIALYRDRLGIRLALDRSFPQWGARLLFFRLGGVTVEVAARLDRPQAETAPDRFWGLAWRAPDVDAARQRLGASGFDVSDARTGRKAGTRVCTLHAPTCGVATLLIGPDSPTVGRSSSGRPRG